ncbi:9168_t:CDS:2 [Paraglomus brasilianum]|uniref:18S rRNA factor 2 n=1 Tax=Paraglomus brasilianum TaxID=144538 RepID=A0A9N9GUG5_9GLOM|nr:9168_t:CDS:2 [Paraglomus brasilianum]
MSASTESEQVDPTNVGPSIQKTLKPITEKKLAKFQEEQRKTGVVYLSRIPPFMKPQKVRYLLQAYGEIGRIYLAPEDQKVRQRRKKFGGNGKKNYTEGWVEFLDKKVAKVVANMLNAKPIGGKKRFYYHDDLWNIKYLPGFKWDHLTGQIAYEKAARTKRLQMEISQARRENKDYIKKGFVDRILQGSQDNKLGRNKIGDKNMFNKTFSFSMVDSDELEK